jgi:Integrase zinc binding domain
MDMKRTILHSYHDGVTAGHPGTWKTYASILRSYWWPTLKPDVMEYVKGCATCQANKTITRRNVPPIDPIIPQGEPTPFAHIAVDFITKLPLSAGHNTIMTITDQGCMKAVILLPCSEESGSEDVAKLFLERAFPFIGLPSQVISDRDTRFTSQFFREVCWQLNVKQNLSTAYHPQTDGQSEYTNQTLEAALRIYCNHQQNNWAQWLPILQYVLNSQVSATTKQIPFMTWMGYLPCAHQPTREGDVPAVEERKRLMKQAREDAHKAMAKAQSFWNKKMNFHPYQKGQKV